LCPFIFPAFSCTILQIIKNRSYKFPQHRTPAATVRPAQDLRTSVFLCDILRFCFFIWKQDINWPTPKPTAWNQRLQYIASVLIIFLFRLNPPPPRFSYYLS
jgi:hypothetical protein